MPPLIAVAVQAVALAFYEIGVTYAVAQVIGSIVIYGALVGGSIAYSSSQNAKMRNSLKNLTTDPGRDVMSRDPLASWRLVYGQMPLSGTITYMATTGAKNQDLHINVNVAAHECAELGTIYVDDFEEVALDGAGNATGRLAGYFHLDKHDGGPAQAADSNLLGAFPGVWTTDHVLAGHAYLHTLLHYNADLYPNGPPTVKCMVKGKKVYDPRDGAQNPADPTTWVWSDNSALCTADYLHDPIFGKGVPWSRISMAALIEAANICDETVVLADSSTQKRYTCNGTVTSDQDAATVLSALVGSMAGFVVDTGGVWHVRAGAYRTVNAPTFTDDDIVSGVTVQPRQSMRDTYNGVKGIFISPENQWAASDFPVVKNDTYMGWDGGKRLWKDVAYNFTNSSPMAQRISKIDLERGRQQIIFTATFNLKAFQVMPGDTVRLTRPSLGWTDKEFEVVSWAFQATGNDAAPMLGVQLTLKETAAAVWDWADGAETTIDLAPNSNLPDPSVVGTPTGLTILTDSTTSITQPDGVFVPRLKVSWNTPNDIYVESNGRVRIEYKQHAASTWLQWDAVLGSLLLDYITDVKVGVSYDVRVQFQNEIGVRGAYATVSNYTVAGDNAGPAAPTGLTAIAGTGQVVSLDWDDNTEGDFSEYGVYRNTTNTPSTATKVAEVRASRFVDVFLTIGTTYYYWVTAYDNSENQSAKSTGANATPGTVVSVADSTPPSDPSAPTLDTRGTYLAGDGTVFSFISINIPALPTGAAELDVFYRKTGSDGWTVTDQWDVNRTDSPRRTRIDDLSPGTSYDVGVLALSSFGVPSNFVAATGSPFTAPNRTTAPAALTGGTLSATGVIPALQFGGVSYLFGTNISWNPSSEIDFAYYEVKATSGDTDGDTSYTWAGPGSANAIYRTTEKTVCFYCATPTVGYVRIRQVNTSLVAGPWAALGNANGAAAYGAKTMALQDATSVLVTTIQSGSYKTTSSRRYKKNIRPLKGCLKKTVKIQEVRYDAKDGSGRNQLGFLAEQVNKVEPSLVSKKKVGKSRRKRVEAMDYSRMTVLHNGAIRELVEKIDKLEGKIRGIGIRSRRR